MAANAYASEAGYREGETYSPFDLGMSFTQHRGHGDVTYTGVNAGNLEFRCDCTDAIWVVPPGASDRSEIAEARTAPMGDADLDRVIRKIARAEQAVRAGAGPVGEALGKARMFLGDAVVAHARGDLQRKAESVSAAETWAHGTLTRFGYPGDQAQQIMADDPGVYDQAPDEDYA